jgi:hypothetical protein
LERQRTAYLHDFIVYVCGVDISKYVKEISISYTDRNSPSSCDITLTNPFDQWMLTDQNFRGYWRLAASRYSEKQKQQIFLKKRNLSLATVRMKTDPNRLNPDNAGSLQGADNRTQAGTLNQLKQAQDQDFMQRYTFGPGSLVFSKFDTIKIYIKNPSDPENSNRWIPAFTGTVYDKNVTTDFVTGASLVHLQGYDIRQVMHAMRIAVNPMTNSNFTNQKDLAKTQTAVIDQFDSSFFKDIYPVNASTNTTQRDTAYDNVFAGLSFVDSVSLLLTGKYKWVSGKNPVNGFAGAALGFFTPGQVVKYANPKNSGAKNNPHRNLEDWDNLCLFGEKKTFWTEAECHDDGQYSFWDSALNDSANSSTPMNGSVHWLIPADGLNITNSVTQAVEGLNNVTGSLDWQDRYSLLTNLLRRIDYECNVSGAGDFILEFPLYDFFPSDFGSNESIYIFDKHLKDENLSDESGDIVTALEATTTGVSLADQGQSGALNPEQLKLLGIGQRAVVVAPILASRYGVRVQAITITGVDPKALGTFAMYEFQKLLADSNKTSFNASYRPFLRPNRPIMHKTRNRIGKSTTIRLNLPALRMPTISIAMHCVRNPIYRNGEIAYMHVTGGASMALSYNSVFENPNGVLSNNNSGLLLMYQPNPTTSNQ